MMKKEKILISMILTLSLTPLLAQEAITDEEEIFELSPFEVSVANDRGYLSTNSISGTSLNTAIRDLPMPLEVINQELIEDLQATDLEESLEYSAGVYTQSFENNTGANEGSFADNSPSATNLNAAYTNTISLRGYTVPNNQRFGFRVGAIIPRYNVVLGGSTDTVTTERIEVVRGPQALLYGINVLSGIVNIIPKEPLFDPAYRADISAGSYDYMRASVDATGPIIRNKLAYRFMASYTEEGHWTMFQETEREDYAVQLKWRITPKYDLFVEVKQSNFLNTGIGSKYFSDNAPAGASLFRWSNEWDENITFGRDDIERPLVSDRGTVFESPWVPRTDYNYAEKLFDLGNNYRISGPDTYFERDEFTITGVLRAKFTDKLSGEFGYYHVQQEEEIFNVDLRTFNGSRGPVRPTTAPVGFFGKPPTDRNVTSAMELWFMNPEVSLGGTRGPLDVHGDENYLVSRSVGEGLVFPTYRAGQLYPSVLPPEIPQQFDDPDTHSWNRRYARYVWFKDSNKAESTQLRARLAYNFDWDLFSIPANHTFSVGGNYIGDVIEFNNSGISGYNDNWVYSSFQPEPERSKLDDDPYYFRQSALDLTPLRYNGENVAILANPSYRRLADFRSGATSGDNGSTIARSGQKEATLWYRGFYGLYQGKFWEDKLHIIGGVRQDQYQVKETEDLMIIDQLRISDVWQGSVDPLTPWFIGDGRGTYKSPDGIPNELDDRVRIDYARLQELQPEGTTEYNFDEYQKFTTGTFGFSYRIIDPVSVYYLYSDGVFPNTGQRDGAYEPIDAEQTVNNEIGFKFDILDGKISGTISFYRIERENAVYYWQYAPAPVKWQGGPLEPLSRNDSSAFSPQSATGPGSEYYSSQHFPVSYSVAMDYVEQAFDEMGLEFPIVAGSFPPDSFSRYGGNGVSSGHMQGAVYHPYDRVILNVDYETLKNAPEAEVLRRAFEIARVSEDPISFPFNWWSFGASYENNSPSNSGGAGANVTFAEEGNGVDGQLIFTPIPNYQVIFSYSYQEREVTEFNLVDAVDLETGINWGTEYDIWVYLLNRENFTDPTRPSTFTGGSVEGLDLSFVPKFSGKLWNMYRFSEGPLEGFRIGGGVQYIGSAPTSVSIGGSRLTENLYRTPDTPDRFILDVSASYKWSWADIDWYLSLRIGNLLDDREETVEVSYDTVLGSVEKRRTRIYYAPRTWRLSLTARF